MISSRQNTFKTFNQYKQNFNDKSIDDLCNKNNTFELQPQQLFLKDFFQKNFDNIKQFLLYHEIGSGKTCTSIILAELFLKLNNNNKIVVILPARLKNNFYDELLSNCTNFKYFTKNDFNLYNDLNTSINDKQKLRKKFINEINKFYNIISYEAFRILCLKNTNNIIEFLNIFSKNKMIIIDELHNVISDSYDIDTYIKIENTGIIDKNDLKSISINSTLIKLLSKFSHNSTKLLFLTATPIYDSIKELSELTYILNPSFGDVKFNLKNNDFKTNLNKLKGKISYYPGSSKKAYPKSNLITHNIPMSKIQDKMTYDVLNNNKDNLFEKEAFLANQRQIAISCLSKKYNINQIVNNLQLYSPKIYKLINIINNNNIHGKHVIYTNFINVGVKIIEKFLLNNGWISIFDVYNNIGLWNKYQNKVFAIWSGNENDTKKNLIKNIINSNDNIFGNKIKLLIGSPSIKEGISFKHIQHIHLLDPVWNISGKKQVEGRAIRFCSHYDIKENIHKNLKRIINIHVYKLVPLKNNIRFIDYTVDQKLYDDILPNKYKDVEILEKYLKYIAIDYHIFKKLYISNTKSPNSNSNSTISIDLHKNKNIVKKKTKTEKKITCNPKIRRPNKINNKCDNSLYPFKKINKHKDFCCYKKSINIIKSSCYPKNRRPINGKCLDGLFLRKNKNNHDCCYKFDK